MTLKIAFIASEGVPFIKSGGLADVLGALPKALRRLGHQVIVILPGYAAIDASRHKIQPFLSPLGVWMGDALEWCAALRGEHEGVTTYFIESEKHFARWGLYHDADFNDYQDNARRFSFFTRAALQLCRDMGFAPDVVHAHDWQTALAPAYLKIWHWDDPILGGAASLLTIHNIAYQGVYSAADYGYLGLQAGNFTTDKFEDHGRVNFLKGGIQYADLVNTVSPAYARETRSPEYAHGLAPYLNDKGDRYLGILNGADTDYWDPQTDPLLPANYSASDLAGKAACKIALQERFLLERDANIPLVGLISRLVPQKGVDLLVGTVERMVKEMRVQFILLGAGDKALERYFGELPGRFPGRVGSHIGYHEQNSHWIQAGADFLLMPSRFEPCGLNQMYAQRYGTLPIVRATGGLEDTVQQYNEASGEGTGYKFWEPSAHAIYYTTGWAVSTYYDRPAHLRKMQQAAMQKDYSWENSARQYEAAYRRAVGFKGGSAILA